MRILYLIIKSTVKQINKKRFKVAYYNALGALRDINKAFFSKLVN